jgi:hypothetical protein
MKNIVLFLSFTAASLNALSQKNDKTVKSLVKAEITFSEQASKETIQKAFLEVTDLNCIVFKPHPVIAKEYYETNKISGKISWRPEFAMISKAGDFGFNTGPYIYNDFEKNTYGHYLSVWKADKNRKWKLVLNGEVKHQKPNTQMPEVFLNPDNYKYPKLIGPQKIKMREDIVFSTDLLLGKSLAKSGNISFNEFYDNSVRLYFPNHLPEYGKVAVLKFINSQKINIKSTPIATDRAFSGDLAYTYGEAVINSMKYYYIRIWQIDANMKWNIIVDAYMPC